MNQITIYTDGSCNTEFRIGSWAAIILYGEEKIILNEFSPDTTNQRMELTAVIRSLEYIRKNKLILFPITVYTDSQYVIDLPSRKEKLRSKNFITQKKTILPNADLLESLFSLSEGLTITFKKILGHQKKTEENNFNREADMLCRKKVREVVSSL